MDFSASFTTEWFKILLGIGVIFSSLLIKIWHLIEVLTSHHYLIVLPVRCLLMYWQWYVCICVCVYVCICVYMCIYIYVCVSVCMCLCLCFSVCVCCYFPTPSVLHFPASYVYSRVTKKKLSRQTNNKYYYNTTTTWHQYCFCKFSQLFL